MLSLWANWLQLNSQLNSPGVSFWLYRTSFGRLFQFEITSGKNELASCVVEMVLDVTSYCSSWERRSLVIFFVAYWFRSEMKFSVDNFVETSEA